MTKAPKPGRVKTRLSPPLTPEEAAGLNTCFLRDTSAAITAAVSDGLAMGVGVYTPVGEEAAYDGILPNDFALIPQRGDAFGERLTFAMEDLLGVRFESACLINSDSPTVPAQAYADAARVLHESGDDRIVFGASDDGGYYLIGMKKLHRRLFQEIDWSTERVAEQTMARAAEIGMEIYHLPTWYDVDDRATLRRLCNDLLKPRPVGRDSVEPGAQRTQGYPAPATKNFLQAIIDHEGRDRIWPNE